VTHAFTRDANGTIASFDPAGSSFTAAYGITRNGAVAGYYDDSSFVAHGFLRAPDGTVATFDAPGGTNGTYVNGVSADGWLAGYTIDGEFVAHGFVRSPEGKIKVFDAPESTGTFAQTAGGRGDRHGVIGFYDDSAGNAHGYLRAPK
jgi:hypothetical protein